MSTFANYEDRFGLPLFAKRGITLVKGENAFVWDIEGRRYIDCAAGHGVANVGHGNPFVVKAVEGQAQRLMVVSNAFYNDQRGLLMKKLVEITPQSLNKVFLCNSGTEAVEAALKFARFSTGNSEFVCARRGFHGRTMGALSATFNPKYKRDFEPLVPGFHFATFNDFESVERLVNERTAGILLEVVQGEGGVHIGRADFFAKVQALCREKEILLIIDEVQTGLGRTGRMFASEYFDLQPDILCLAKGLGGGIPIGAVLCSDRVHLKYGKHGTTFGGNPLASAAALATIDYIEQNDLAKKAEQKGKYFARLLNAYHLPLLKELRQIGLMIGIEIKEKAQPFISALQDEGIIVLPAGPKVIRLLPPLTIEYELIDWVVKKVAEVLK